MKRTILYIVFCFTLLLGACTKPVQEPKFYEDLQQLNKGGGSGKKDGVVLDAIIDTEAEYAYINSVHSEYEMWKAKYDSTTTQLSSLLGGLKGSAMEQEKGYLQKYLTDVSAYKTKIGSIDLPDGYRASILAALEAYSSSIRHELKKVAENEGGTISEETTKVSNKLYEVAQESNLKVQAIYNEIMK